MLVDFFKRTMKKNRDEAEIMLVKFIKQKSFWSLQQCLTVTATSGAAECVEDTSVRQLVSR